MDLGSETAPTRCGCNVSVRPIHATARNGGNRAARRGAEAQASAGSAGLLADRDAAGVQFAGMGLDFLKGSGKDWLKEASGFNDWWSDIRADLKRPFEDQDPLLDEEFPSSVADLSLLDLEPDEDLDVCLLSIKKFKFRADVAPKLPLDESLLKLKLPCEIDILGLPIPAITGRLRFPVGDIPSGLGDFDDDVQWDVGVFQEITFGGKDR